MTLVEINKKADTTFDKNQVEHFCRLQNDQMWIITHKSQLRKEFANRYVAVKNEAVCFVGRSMDELIANIAKGHRQSDEFAIDFISEHPTNLLL